MNFRHVDNLPSLLILTGVLLASLFPISAFAQITPVKDIAPGSVSSLMGGRYADNGMLQIGDSLFFWANDGIHGMEPWLTDGTDTGTIMLGDIWPGAEGSEGAEGFIQLDNWLVFVANDSIHGEELWRFDLQTGALTMIDEMNPGSGDAEIDLTQATCCNNAMVFKNHLYFRGTDTPDLEDVELWRTDGNTVELWKDIYPGGFSVGNKLRSSNPEDFVVFDGFLYFEATTEEEGSAIWRTTGDGTSTGLFAQVSAPGTKAFGWWGQHVLGDKLIFATRYFRAAQNTTGSELWVIDGATDSVSLLKEIWPGKNAVADHFYFDFAEFGGQFLFWGVDSAHGPELWRTDGTTAGTELFAETVPGPDGGHFTSTLQLYTTQLNNLLYIQLAQPTLSPGPYDIWQSDGTPQGTGLIAQDFLTPMHLPFVVEQGGLYWSWGDEDTYGRELYWSDGINPAQIVQDLNPGPGNSTTSRIVNLGDKLVFAAYSPDFGLELATVDPQSLSVSEATEIAVRLSPNPGTNQLRIEAGKPLSEAPRFLSLTGQTVDAPASGSGQVWQLNTQALPAGVYVVEVVLYSGERRWVRWVRGE